MWIGGLDVKTTQQLKKRSERKERDKHSIEKDVAKGNMPSTPGEAQNMPSTSGEAQNVPFTSDEAIQAVVSQTPESDDSLSGISSLSLDTDKEIKFYLSSAKKKQEKMKKYSKVPALAKFCDRFSLSDRAGAGAASAVLEDFGIITTEDQSKVIDKSKLRRAHKRTRDEARQYSLSENIEAIFFDGRKDVTKVNIAKDGKFYGGTVVEEHITVLSEPDSFYFRHFTPKTGTATDIANGLIEFLKKKEIATENIKAIGCDGTNVNTGTNNGVIRQLEQHLGCSFHWFVFLLHSNELPLRHLVNKLDGATKGPSSFSGEIGKFLQNCEKMPVIDFVEPNQCSRSTTHL
jgi:hypothetical protein